MKLVALTGGIGSGKSTVSGLLAARGAAIVDADAVTRQLQQPGQPVLAAIVERFGADVVEDDGSLARQRLADKVFSDPDAVADLNGIVHPAVLDEMERQAQAFVGTDRVVVLDMPLLTQPERYPLQGIIVVDAPLEVAVERLVAIRGMREDDAWVRIARQASREERVALATWALDNSSDLAHLEAQVDQLWSSIGALPPLDAEGWR